MVSRSLDSLSQPLSPEHFSPLARTLAIACDIKSCVGDRVNVAARLESFDKSIDGGVCRILISERFPTKAIGSVLLKGRQQEEEIYQVLI